MKIKCLYCNSEISETDEKCPYCGAINNNLKRVGNNVPTTIKELKNWYAEHNLPDEETTRFFIGKNYEGARAFGIYFDEQTRKYVVYKNKGDGQRAIRYEGPDEAYAVNELYLRLKEEIQNQKRLNKKNNPGQHHIFDSILKIFAALLLIIPLIIILTAFYCSFQSIQRDGYYNYENNIYYFYNNDWYSVVDPVNNTWDYIGYSNPIPKKFIKKYYSERNTSKDNIPDNIEFMRSGYYFEYCSDKAYYTSDNNKFYYYYKNYWYIYDKNNTKFGRNNWEKLFPNEYVEKFDKSVRTKCYDYEKEYNSSWGIKDFRESGYYDPDEGYYTINGVHYYYFKEHGWYYYDNTWNKSSHSPADNYYEYYESSSNNYDEVSDFKNSTYYQDYLESQRRDNDYDNDWDSSSSWDSNDSWDSGGTDWDSDW